MKNRSLESLSQRASIAVDLVKNTFASNAPGAAYLISYQGKTLESGGVGKANLEWNLSNTENTVFRLGSISKPITAIAILQLAERGKLNLDQPISIYAPDLPAHMGAVSMRQILSHRSGLAEHAFDESLMPFIWQPMTTNKIIELQDGKPKDFEPGTEYAYVNFNYVIAAHIVEQITSQSFVDFANNEIFAANDMENSHYDEHDPIIPNRAEFYDQHDGVVKNSADIDMSHVSAAGALLSSATDMGHWAQYLVDGKLVSPALLAEAWTPAPLPDGSPTKYGLGFNVEEMEGERVIWHTGLTPGAQAAFDLAPDSEIFIILLSNGFHLPNTGKLVDDMMKIMLTASQSESSTESNG